MGMPWYRRTINGRGRGRGIVAVRQAADCEPRRAVALIHCAESLWQAAFRTWRKDTHDIYNASAFFCVCVPRRSTAASHPAPFFSTLFPVADVVLTRAVAQGRDKQKC